MTTAPLCSGAPGSITESAEIINTKYRKGPGREAPPAHPTLARACFATGLLGQLRRGREEDSSGTQPKPCERKACQAWAKLGLREGKGQELAEDAEDSKGKPHWPSFWSYCSPFCKELAQNFTALCHRPVEPASTQKPQHRAFPWVEHFCSGKFEELTTQTWSTSILSTSQA